jgi:metallophosphoesterase superfamily enzyme
LKKTLFVISDLHLGGEAGFQMCSPAGRKRLADFIAYSAAHKKDDHEVQLVLNGDIVDFLAEKEFSSFTNNDRAARSKLERIMKSTSEVWESLGGLASRGVRLTLMLGNHDTELSLPGPRRLLLDTIGRDRVEFIHDNEAFVEGPVLSEHGNRCFQRLSLPPASRWTRLVDPRD